MLDLGTLGGLVGMATAINDHGRIVGHTDDVEGRLRGFMWEDGHLQDLGLPECVDLSATLNWADGSSTYLEQPERTEVYVNDVNNPGQVVGGVIALYSTFDQDIIAGFVWESGSVTILDVIPLAINNSGRIVAEEDAGWTTSSRLTIEVGGFDAVDSRRLTERAVVLGATAMNDRAQIAGCKSSKDGPAFLLDADHYVDLGILDSGHEYSLATGINNRGQIVGWSGPATTREITVQDRAVVDEPLMRPFLWEQGRMLPLDTLVSDGDDFARPLICQASRWGRPTINESGQIVGMLQTQSGEHHAFLCV